MAAVYEHLVDEEELLALRELAATDVEETDSADRAMGADLMTLLRKVADLDGAGQALCPEELAWLQGLEEDTVRTEKEMASMAEGILRGAAVLDTRPGEDQAAVAAELRRQAVQCRARAADARQVAAAARCLREKETRRMAAVEHVVDPNVMAFLARVAGEMDHYASLSTSTMPEEVAAAVGAAELVEEEMATLRLWLVMAAMDCAKRPGEAALVAPLRRQADKAKAALAGVDSFRASMRRYQAAAGIAPPPEEEEGSDDDMMT